MVAVYDEQVRALVDGGVDILLPETSFDTLVMKACLFAIDKYFDETRHAPAGDGLRHHLREPPHALGPAGRGVLHLGVALRRPERRPQLRRRRGPDAAGDRERCRRSARTRVSCYPNAGLPDGFGGFKGDRDHTAAALGEFARNGWVNLVGGCCGTTPEWIHAIAEAVKDVPPRKIPDLPRLVLLQRDRSAGRPARDQLHHGRRADQHHRLEAALPGSSRKAISTRRWRWPASRSRTAPTSST